MKPGDMVRSRVNTSTNKTDSHDSFHGNWGCYVSANQVLIYVKKSDNVPLPGCSSYIMVLAPSGLGWIPEHFLEKVG